jgi:Flp pilus assembly protein TadD
VILGFSGLLPPERAWSLAESEAQRALELEPAAAEPHIALGFVALLQDRDRAAARAHLEQAVAASPGASAPRQWLALLLALEGKVDAAGSEIDRARELDPLSPIANTLAAFQRALARRNDDELELARRVVELDPRLFLGHWSLGLAQLRAGDLDEAVASHRRAAELGMNAPFLRAVLAWTLAAAGRGDEARRALDQLVEEGFSPYQRATILAALGRTDEALAALRAACESGDPWAILVGVDPMLDPLRSHPELGRLAWSPRR